MLKSGPPRRPSIGVGGAAPGADPLFLRKRADKLMAAGKQRDAADCYLRYLAAPIAHPDLRAASSALAQGQFGVALARATSFSQANPTDPVARRMLGQIALCLQNFDQAERIFASLVALVPAANQLRFSLVTSLFLQGKAEAALVELEVLLGREPKNPTFRAAKAATLARLGQFEQSAAVYEEVLAEHPDDPKHWVSYGEMLRTLRRRDDALAAFRRAVALRPEHGEAWWSIANMKTGALLEQDQELIRSALASSKATAEDRYHLRFALARGLEEAAQFEQSLAEYKRANHDRLAVLPQSRHAGAAGIALRAAALFTRDFIEARRDAGHLSDAPIFILGMPRSGSTLLEQILSSHPEIEGTQELTAIPLLARELDLRKDGTFGCYPDSLANLAASRLRALGEEYLERTRVERKTNRPFFLDKQPANWLHVGLIRLILPHARIIDMRRSALECCLSMFRQHFARGGEYSYSMARVAAEYRAYHDLMAHFDVVAPGSVKRVQLASLVDDFEGTLRDLLDRLGLPFAEQCLRYHESDRAVFTPSSEQVRRPINREGADLARNFMPFLGELRAELGDLAES